MTDPELVARAEHELRGAATALSLACEALRRDPVAREHAAVIDAQWTGSGPAWPIWNRREEAVPNLNRRKGWSFPP